MKDYFVLTHTVKELKNLETTVLVECFTQEKNCLYFQFYDGIALKTLQFSAEPGFETLFLRKNFVKARSNYKDLFQSLIGANCLQVSQLEGERIVIFKFSTAELWFVLFGGSKTNAFVVDHNNIIKDCFLKPKEYLGKNIDFVFERKTFGEVKTLKDYLVRQKFFSKEIANYICKMLELDSELSLIELSPSEKDKLERLVANFEEKIRNSKEYYCYFHNHNFFVSPLELKGYEVLEKFSSVSDAIYSCYRRNIRYRNSKEKYLKYQKMLSNKLKHLKNELESFEKLHLMDQNIQLYQKYADLLFSQPNLSLKCIENLELQDFEGNEVKIPLIPELTLKENAEAYYSKAKKLKASVSEKLRKNDEIKLRYIEVKNAYDFLVGISNYEKIEEFEKQFSGILKEGRQEAGPATKFRCFELDDGAVLYVGKNAQSNEELTFGFARPNDYWFHARGVGGSHCVLKYSKGKEPPQKIIERAAQVAAYFSKAKNSDYVPVSYTQRKYVKKPKRAEKGTVVLMREEVIFVKPEPPAGFSSV
jgi:predicted ribosome quality control (RQC) complex YloA/Tae2 family protein